MNKTNSLWRSIFLFACIGFMISCSGKSDRTVSTQDFRILRDDLGREVKIRQTPDTLAQRFLPFAPSVTEMLFLVCDTAEIVGRTQNCNYPPQALSKPEINNYPPDLEKILSVKPDLLITKDGMLSPAQADAIEKMGVPVYFQKYDRVNDIFYGLEKLATLTGHEERGKSVADSLNKALEAISAPGKDAMKRKKVLMLISNESYFVFGKETYASDIVWKAGGINAVDSVYNNSYPVLTAEYILKINPDVILGGAQVGLEKDFFELHKELKRTNAYKNRQYFTINDDYLSRPGPRVVEAVREVRAILDKGILGQ